MNKKLVSAALGTFDGIHKAHKTILENALNNSENTICITFRKPPKASGFIMQPELKQKELSEMGFSKIVMLDFDEVKNVEAETFLKTITDEYKITDFFVGYDYRFGKNGQGDVQVLKDFCEKNGLLAHIQEPIKEGNEIISSSSIRDLLKEGNLQKAIKFLGRYPEIHALVSHGDQRGRELGFPTINQALPEGFCELKFGVYASEVLIGNKRYCAITDIGIRPTFPSKNPVIETHILDFHGNLYEKEISVFLCSFLREERKFNSAQELMAQIDKDVCARRGVL